MKKIYSAPIPGLKSVTFGGNPNGEDVILVSRKAFVVLVETIQTEGIERDDCSGLRPIEEGGEGFSVQESDESQHEFDTVSEAKDFARAQHNPDRSPVETKILEFRKGKWEVIEHLPTSV